MRRPVIYLAGLLLATGASLAMAGPAAAAVTDRSGSAYSSSDRDFDIDDSEFDIDFDSRSYDIHSEDNDPVTQFGLVNVNDLPLLNILNGSVN